MICEHFHWTLAEHDAQDWNALRTAWSIVIGLAKGRSKRG